MRFMIMPLMLLGLVACAGTANHKEGITHLPASARSSPTAIKKMGHFGHGGAGHGQCLNVATLAHELSSDATTYSVYTSDLALGQLQIAPGGKSCAEFKPNGDTAANAFLFFKGGPNFRPKNESLIGPELGASEQVGTALSAGAQEGCANVTLAKGGFNGPLDVLCQKGDLRLDVQGTTSAGPVVISYQISDDNLTIVEYTPLNAPASCPMKSFAGQVVRRTSVISWSTLNTKMRISKSLAQMLTKFIPVRPSELDQALTLKSAGAINLSSQTYLYLINILNLDNRIDSALTCPDQVNLP